MKKALSLVLALVMVLSMAVVGFAADVEGDLYTATISDIDEDGYVTVDVDPVDDATDVNVIAYDDEGEEITDITEVSEYNCVFEINAGDAEAVYVVIEVTAGELKDADTYKVVAAPEEDGVSPAVIAAVIEAIENHSTELVIYTTELTAKDFEFITNSYDDSWDWTSALLGFEVTVVVDEEMGAKYGPIYFDLGLVDYTWTKAIDFSVDYSAATADEYAMIRKLTGDTKNPLVFGFSGDAVPAGTEIDMVIPQAFINYYGHKNLTLFAWKAPITATYDDNAGDKAGTKITMEDAKVLAETTLDVNTTVTQRIQFTTDTLYKTLVLSANGTPVEDGAAVEDNKDANPNTGANDIVNVAVVFAVVSLAAAGALVCKKSK